METTKKAWTYRFRLYSHVEKIHVQCYYARFSSQKFNLWLQCYKKVMQWQLASEPNQRDTVCIHQPTEQSWSKPDHGHSDRRTHATTKRFLFTLVEVRDSPARDSCSLHVVLQGSHQMGRVLGTPPPPSSPSSGSSGRHSGWGTIFAVCPYGIGPWWKLWTLWDRGFAQNFDTFHMGRVVWPGEPFLKKSLNFKNMYFSFENMCVQEIQKCHLSVFRKIKRENHEENKKEKHKINAGGAM